MYVQNAPGVAQSAQEARVLSTGRAIHLKPGPPRILVIYRYIYICIYTDKTSLKADREVEGGGGFDWAHLVSLGLSWTHLKPCYLLGF